MKAIYSLLLSLALATLIVSCQTTETIVSSPYKLEKKKSIVYSAKTFMFKNYYFTYQDGEATLVYQQDSKLNQDSTPIYLTLTENKENTRYQEFIDKSKQITVKIISDHEVRLQLDRARYTLYTSNHLKEVNADTHRILANSSIWKNDRY
ncbi:hypothetical protein HX052_11275 [Myroides marinus]|jgi:hypothetical protein|uniref:Lipoprotein n=1 Tax=Myroides marinus TaxID=703342 RepID=A0A1H6WUE9_9FLAO|nr:hypothetical protein [Myroides marinus]MDR0228637.1 hypothetical protein [Flavobacteriaceae bacterium]MDM1360432.1 hypothetical protein [Myroides marinus]MDM1369102.1 hypothetical protein [Myroides marinus]MDM1372099.1 hypothetical protein [Myroides marinus]MDM1376044.1 hypothetical protein [Myroides marinus]